MKKLKGVVIGCGNFGTQEIEALTAIGGAEIIAAVDVNESRRRQVRKKFGVRTLADYREALDLQPDFAYISSPNSFHKEQVVAAARRGVHIYCEKPIALTLRDADQMVAAVKRSGVKAVVGFGMHLSPLSVKIHEMVKKGELGRIISTWVHTIRGYGLSKHPAVLNPSLSGGWLIHHACHAVNWFLGYFGPIKEVYCETNSSLKGRGQEEIIWASFKFASGTLGSLYESVGVSKFRNRGIVGTKGTVIFDQKYDYKTKLSPPLYLKGEAYLFRERTGSEKRKTGVFQHELGFEPPGLSKKMTEKRGFGRLSTARAFLDCLRGRRPVWSGMEEGREALRVTLAMKKSAEEKRAVSVAKIV